MTEEEMELIAQMAAAIVLAALQPPDEPPPEPDPPPGGEVDWRALWESHMVVAMPQGEITTARFLLEAQSFCDAASRLAGNWLSAGWWACLSDQLRAWSEMDEGVPVNQAMPFHRWCSMVLDAINAEGKQEDGSYQKVSFAKFLDALQDGWKAAASHIGKRVSPALGLLLASIGADLTRWHLLLGEKAGAPWYHPGGGSTDGISTPG